MSVATRSAFMGSHRRIQAYKDIGAILGDGGTDYAIIPIGDWNHENPARTTVTTVGQGAGNGLVFTYSEALSAWDTPHKHQANQLYLPYGVRFNGTDEQADSPDTDFWSRGDGLNDSPCSFGTWVNVDNTGGWRTILVKGDLEEWDFRISPAREAQLVLADSSTGAFSHRVSGVIPLSVPVSVVATYDGVGGASAADGIDLYVSGVLSNGLVTNDGGYVAMENGTGLPTLGERPVVPERFNGGMCGGAIGTFLTHQKLTAPQVRELTHIGVAAQQ